MANVLVVAELTEDGSVRKTTHSAIAFAKSASGGGSFSILCLGAKAKAGAAELTGFGAAKVLACEDASLANYLAETYAPTVAEVGKGFDVLVATASSFGKDLMPRVAGRLGAAYAGDCAGVADEGGKLTYKRPLYAGNAFGYCQLSTDKQVATCRQSEVDPAEPSGGASPVEDVAVVGPGAGAARLQHLGVATVKSERPELTEASVVVSGGRAIKEKFFDIMEPLADTLGAAIGASRAACDAGYCPGDYQVGQTGKIVAPSLYIAVGISGAIQHIAGMKGSKTIVAVNKDPEAPIFTISDYGLVADLFQAVPAMVEEIKKHQASK